MQYFDALKNIQMAVYEISWLGIWQWIILLSISLVLPSNLVSGSLIRIENGAYKRVTVLVSEDVSKCHCDQVIENIKVRIYYSS